MLRARQGPDPKANTSKDVLALRTYPSAVGIRDCAKLPAGDRQLILNCGLQAKPCSSRRSTMVEQALLRGSYPIKSSNATLSDRSSN